MDVDLDVRSESVTESNDLRSMDAEEGELTDDFDDPPYNCEKIEDKLQLRAKRFGLSNPLNGSSSHDKAINRLYSSMGIDQDSRLEALHMFGMEIMKTQDIFEYFAGHAPVSVERITDRTCNVVWLDERSAALALLACSVRIKGHNTGGFSPGSDLSDEEYVNVEDLRLALPPGIWRKGHFRPYAPNVFLRFASRADRKDFKKEPIGDLHGKSVTFLDCGDEGITKVVHETGNPWSDIARQWGQYEQINTKERAPVRDARELIKMREVKDISSPGNRDVLLPIKENTPYADKHFGKMHADLEERKILKRRQLQSSPKLSTHGQIDLRHRLGRKRPRTLDIVSSDSSEEDTPVQPDSIKSRLGSVVWSAFESGDSSDDSDEIEVRPSATDLRQKLMKTSSNPPFHPPSPLQIEIDNDHYYSNNPGLTGDS